MAVYEIGFSGEVTGSPPANFTARWTSTNEAWTVREKATTITGKCLEHTQTAAAHRLYSWDTPGTDTESEILVRWRTNSPGGGQIRLYVRGGGAAGSEEGYLFDLQGATTVRIARLSAGTITTLGANVSVPFIQANKWYWTRLRVNGSDIKARMWDGDHEQEPTAWTVERTDGTIAGPGWIGIGNNASIGTQDYDEIAVGTNGDTAAFSSGGAVRITQVPSLVLSAADSEVRVTQAAVLVMAQLMESAPIRVTQATVLALAEYDAPILITQAAVLVLADQVPCLTRWAQCWTITRTDGEVFAFTSLDRPLTFRGIVHQPCNSLMASAVELSTVVGTTGNMELRGILSDGGVSESELYNGLFDGARIEAWAVPWDNSTGEIPFRLMGGVTGANGHGVTEFSQEILTSAAQLQQRGLLETYTPGCRYQFGNSVDPRCPVDLAAITVSGAVTATAIPNASTNSLRRMFTDSSRAEADGYFNLGRVTWTSGPNTGAVSEVKDFTAGSFILWEALLYPISVGDTYDATPGCDKSPAAHLTFNADMVDFGGFPHVPGNDSLLETPDQKG